MTRVTVEYEGDRVRRIECAGHAGNAESGVNIVCAAVSVLMTTCANALEQLAGLADAASVDEKRAMIAVELPDALGKGERDAQTILRTTVLGLTDISHEYPKLVKITTIDGRKQP